MKNENEKSKKFNIVIYLLVLVALFTMLIGTSYAYYIKTIKNGDETKVVIKSSNMLLRFYDGNQINAYDIEPNWESTYNFSIENYSPHTAGKYKIIFDIEKSLIDSVEDSFVFELTGQSSKNNNDKLINRKIVADSLLERYKKQVIIATNMLKQNPDGIIIIIFNA